MVHSNSHRDGDSEYVLDSEGDSRATGPLNIFNISKGNIEAALYSLVVVVPGHGLVLDKCIFDLAGESQQLPVSVIYEGNVGKEVGAKTQKYQTQRHATVFSNLCHELVLQSSLHMLS